MHFSLGWWFVPHCAALEGLDRVREALQCHTWPVMTLKERPQRGVGKGGLWPSGFCFGWMMLLFVPISPVGTAAPAPAAAVSPPAPLAEHPPPPPVSSTDDARGAQHAVAVPAPPEVAKGKAGAEHPTGNAKQAPLLEEQLAALPEDPEKPTSAAPAERRPTEEKDIGEKVTAPSPAQRAEAPEQKASPPQAMRADGGDGEAEEDVDALLARLSGLSIEALAAQVERVCAQHVCLWSGTKEGWAVCASEAL